MNRNNDDDLGDIELLDDEMDNRNRQLQIELDAFDYEERKFEAYKKFTTKTGEGRVLPGPAGDILALEQAYIAQQTQNLTLTQVASSSKRTRDTKDFESQAWKDMLKFFQEEVVTAHKEKYGSDSEIKLSTIQDYKVKNSPFSGKIPLMGLVVHNVLTYDSDALVEFVDPTGVITGTVHYKAIEERPDILTPGTVLLLRKFCIFMPTSTTHHIIVHPDNIVEIFESERTRQSPMKKKTEEVVEMMDEEPKIVPPNEEEIEIPQRPRTLQFSEEEQTSRLYKSSEYEQPPLNEEEMMDEPLEFEPSQTIVAVQSSRKERKVFILDDDPPQSPPKSMNHKQSEPKEPKRKKQKLNPPEEILPPKLQKSIENETKQSNSTEMEIPVMTIDDIKSKQNESKTESQVDNDWFNEEIEDDDDIEDLFKNDKSMAETPPAKQTPPKSTKQSTIFDSNNAFDNDDDIHSLNVNTEDDMYEF